MRHVATTLFLLVGLTNFVPLMGVLGATQLESLYDVSLAGEELLLMRHRAVLLGLIGVFILIAAIRVHWRAIATLVGLASMMSYARLPCDATSDARSGVAAHFLDRRDRQLPAPGWIPDFQVQARP